MFLKVGISEAAAEKKVVVMSLSNIFGTESSIEWNKGFRRLQAVTTYDSDLRGHSSKGNFDFEETPNTEQWLQ